MEIVTEKNGTNLLIEVQGKLDTKSSVKLQEVINAISDDVKKIIVDMENLVYISSSGLRVLLKAVKLMNDRNGKLEVLNSSEYLKETFRITGFDDIFKLI